MKLPRAPGWGQGGQLNDLIDHLQVVIPTPERVALVQQIVRHISEQVIGLGMLCTPYNSMISNRLVEVYGISRISAAGASQYWFCPRRVGRPSEPMRRTLWPLSTRSVRASLSR
jgi:hypothetical protein